MPGVRLRNNGSNVGPTSLLQMLIREMKKGEDGEGKAGNRKDRKKQELRKAGIVTTRIQQQSRYTMFQRSEAEGQEQRGRSWATRGCRYRVGPGRSRRVSLGGSSRSQVAGPGKSVSIRSIEKDLMAETSSPLW